MLWASSKSLRLRGLNRGKKAQSWVGAATLLWGTRMQFRRRNYFNFSRHLCAGEGQPATGSFGHRFLWPCCSSERFSLIWSFQGWWNRVGIRRLCSNLFCLEFSIEKATEVLLLAIHFLFLSACFVKFSQCRRCPKKPCTHHFWCWVFKWRYLWCWAGVGSLHVLFPALGGIWGPWPWEKEINFAALISRLRNWIFCFATHLYQIGNHVFHSEKQNLGPFQQI